MPSVLLDALLATASAAAAGLGAAAYCSRRRGRALTQAVERGSAELAASERLFRALVHSSSDVTLVLDADGLVRYASPAVRRVLGRDTADVHGRPFLALVDGVDEERAALLLDELVADPGAVQVTALRLRHADGGPRYAELALTNLLEDPAVGGVVVNAHDTTERQALEAELAQQAFYDALTGLANRSLFVERVEHGLRGRDRHPEGFAVLLLDLDGFKQVNDAFGHGAGDELLCTVASRLQYCVRPDDTVARLGGDEFALFLEHLDPQAPEAAAGKVAARVLAALAEPVTVAGRAVVVTGSVGVAVVEAATSGVEELVRNADLAMYRAKALGKNQAVVYAAALHEAASQRLTLAAELRAAVEAEQLVLHYQPVVDVATGRVTGAEALLRWPHPTRGLVPPLDFVPVAEENGLIVPLGHWVLREACRQAAAWRALLPPGAPFQMCVNVSGRQFQAAGLVPSVREAVALARLDPRDLVLELTETVLMEDDERSLATLGELRALGLGLAIDDFGTGYSSLRYLDRFPVTALKIDRSFVDGLDRGADASAVARAVLRLGQTLHLDVVAEGVERPDQVEVLRSLGCGHAQGFHYGRPVPAEEFTRLLALPASQVRAAPA